MNNKNGINKRILHTNIYTNMGLSQSRASPSEPVGYAGLLAEAQRNPDSRVSALLSAASVHLFERVDRVSIDDQRAFLKQLEDIVPLYVDKIRAAAAAAPKPEVVSLQTATPSLILYVLIGRVEELVLVDAPEISASAPRNLSKLREIRNIIGALFFVGHVTGNLKKIKIKSRDYFGPKQLDTTLLKLAIARVVAIVGVTTLQREREMTVEPTKPIFFEYTDASGAKERVMINGGRMIYSIFYDPPLNSVAHFWGIAKDQADLGVEFVDGNYIGSGAYGTIYAKRNATPKIAVKLFDGSNGAWNKNSGILSELFAWQYLTFTQQIARDVNAKRPFIVPIRDIGVVGSLYRPHPDSMTKYMDPAYFSQDTLAVSMPLYKMSFRTFSRTSTHKRLDDYRDAFDLQVASQLADALAWIHAQNAVYGDIRAENILVEYPDTPDSNVDTPEFLESFWLSICDFSTTRVFDDKTLKDYARVKLGIAEKDAPHSMQFQTTETGTRDYMAPEASHDIPIALKMYPRMDVFGYGVLLSMLLVPLPYKMWPLDGSSLGYIVQIGYGTVDLTTHFLEIVLEMARVAPDDVRIRSPAARRKHQFTLNSSINGLNEWLRAVETNMPMIGTPSQKNPDLFINALMDPDYRRRPAMRVVAFALRTIAKQALVESIEGRSVKILESLTVADVNRYTSGLPHDVSESIRRRETQWVPFKDEALLDKWKTMMSEISKEAKKHGI
jgi:serine/threonine protein kinase